MPAGGVLFKIVGDPGRLDRDKAHAGVVLGMERTLDQDVAYGVRQLARRPIPDGPTVTTTASCDSFNT